MENWEQFGFVGLFAGFVLLLIDKFLPKKKGDASDELIKALMAAFQENTAVNRELYQYLKTSTSTNDLKIDRIEDSQEKILDNQSRIIELMNTHSTECKAKCGRP
jgi:hypothetical protein